MSTAAVKLNLLPRCISAEGMSVILVVFRVELKVNPFRDYKTLLLSNGDDRLSLELLMKRLDSGENSDYFSYYLYHITSLLSLLWPH